MRVAIVQLGCPKNTIDGEWMAGLLREAGHELTSELRADAVIVNTCGFIDPAKEESIQCILEAAEGKKLGDVGVLLVAGCMVQRYQAELKESIPEIDGFIPPSAISETLRLLEHPDKDLPADGPAQICPGDSPRILSTPPHFAYVKIAEGCDHACAFCSIPGFRGIHRSRPVRDIVEETERLAETGVREVTLVAQDTTDYGKDLLPGEGLAALLAALAAVGGIRWIRFLYAYPNRLTDDVLDAMASLEKAVPYLDLPLQHAHGDILKAMGRGGNADAYLRLIEKARSRIPGLAVRSSFIVGFPGEKRSHFLTLKDFLAAARFDHVGIFPYSREGGTPAYCLGDPVDSRTKRRRAGELMALQQEISLDRNRRRVGEVAEVLVDGVHEETEHLLQGRLATQAYEIDGRVIINDGHAPPGSFVRVQITEAHPYDLVGGIVG